MRPRLRYALSIILCMSAGAAYTADAPPSYVTEAVPNASLCGSGTMSVMLWDIYDAALYAAPGSCGDLSAPHALSLTYSRNFKGAAIADRSAKEMRKVTNTDTISADTLNAWTDAMRELFPNVNKGDSITGLYAPGKKTSFVHNNNPIGAIDDTAFGNPFFSIWLSEKTSAPELRAALLPGHAE